MRTSSLRRFLLSCCPPPHYMFGRRTGDSTSSHGGYFSIETYYRLLVEIININSNEYCGHAVIELGAGPGYFSFAAAVITGREVLAIEESLPRYKFLNDWVKKIRNELKATFGFGDDFIKVCHGNYLLDTVQRLNELMEQEKVFIYVNNYKGCLLNDDKHTQHNLEHKLSSCQNGSVVLSLDSMFTTEEHAYWWEEIIPIKYTRNDVPMLNRVKGNGNQILDDINWYVYTKRSVKCFKGRTRPRLCVRN